MVRGELNFVLRCPGSEVGWLLAVSLNSIQRALHHSAPSNTTPLGANLQLIERARSN